MAYSGTYKGTRFRSILELSCMRHFEAEGLELGSTVLYETVRIPYGKRRMRTYVVDFAIPGTRTLVEVKPLSRSQNKNNRAKRAAAEDWCVREGWTYVVVTEDELHACGSSLTLEQAAGIDEVRLGERSARALRRKQSRKKRKR